MNTVITKLTLGLNFTQISWVVKDIEDKKRFFRKTMGINNFSKTVITSAKEHNGTYYGKPSDAENFVTMACAGGVFIELIQPISGNSIFKDYLDKKPAGGVQHFAYSTPIAQLDKVISDFAAKGFPVISRFNTSWADIVFFDTYNEIGVMTEIMGITKKGEAAIQKMRDDYSMSDRSN